MLPLNAFSNVSHIKVIEKVFQEYKPWDMEYS